MDIYGTCTGYVMKKNFVYLFAILILYLSVIGAISLSVSNNSNGALIFIILITCALIALLIVPIEVPVRRVTLYKMTVNDNIPFNVVLDKYDIVEQRGVTFIVKDKGQPNVNRIEEDAV